MTALLLRQRLQKVERAHGPRIALSIGPDRWTFAELFSVARALADRIDNLAPRKGPIGLWCQRDLLSLAGVLAAVLSDRAFVPLNPGFPVSRIATIALTAELSVILAAEAPESSVAELQSIMGHKVPILSGLATEGAPQAGSAGGHAEGTRAVRDATRYIMFTSGTTGVPKGVRITETNLLSYLDAVADVVKIGPDDRATHFFDLSFDLAIHDIFVTWLAGAQLCVLPKAQTMSIDAYVRDNRITHWFSVPSLAAFCGRLGQLGTGAMPSLRSVLFCGEALPETVARSFLQAAPHAEAWNIYGPTEATIAFTAYRFSDPGALDAQTVVPIGRPMTGGRVRLEPIEGDEGACELWLGGPQVSPGYVNMPEQTASRFITDDDGTRWYRTGDVARWSDRHGLLFLGRSDDQVKVNGYRIELLEIDAALRAAAETEEAASLPWPLSDTGHADQIVGFVVQPRIPSAEIRQRCRARLPHYMVPRRIITLDAMPVTTSGKVDRAALRRLLEP